MPELPDVEHFKTYYQSTAARKTVETIRVSDARILDNVSRPKLVRAVSGERFGAARRHGKHLFIDIGDDAVLAFHFGMTGEFEYSRDSGDDPEYARVLFVLDNGYALSCVSRRMLGSVGMIRDEDAFLRARRIGPDALAVERDAFVEAVLSFRGGLKSFLMDQSRIAGIGNVYSDEILFQARLSPRRTGTKTADVDAASLHRAVRRVLRSAVERNADVEAFPDSWLTPRRGSKDARCPRGCGPLRTATVNGRTARWCPECQR